jgi:hypothetical protein
MCGGGFLPPGDRVRSISEKAPFVLARVALKNIVLPRALSTVPWRASRTVALSLIAISYTSAPSGSESFPAKTLRRNVWDLNLCHICVRSLTSCLRAFAGDIPIV